MRDVGHADGCPLHSLLQSYEQRRSPDSVMGLQHTDDHMPSFRALGRSFKRSLGQELGSTQVDELDLTAVLDAEAISPELLSQGTSET